MGRIKPVPWEAINRRFTLELIVFRNTTWNFPGDCSCLVLVYKVLKYSAKSSEVRAPSCEGVVAYKLEVVSFLRIL